MIGVESHEHVCAVATDNELQAGARRAREIGMVIVMTKITALGLIIFDEIGGQVINMDDDDEEEK